MIFPKAIVLLQTLNLLTFQKLWGYIVCRQIVPDISTIERWYRITSFWLTIHIVTVSYQYLSNFFIARDTCWGSIFLFSSFVRLKFRISSFLTILNMCCLFNFSHKFLKQSKDTIKFLLRSRSKEPTSVCYLSVIR